MKLLEKDRTRRYETANRLARDVQRYLADEPVEACPLSAAYRLRKFARKNRAALTTVAAFAVVLVAGAAVSAWQAVRATRAQAAAETAEREALAERDAKEQALRSETAQRAIAQRQRLRTRQALDDMTSEEALNWLKTQKELLPQQKQFLERALKYYQEFAQEQANDQESRALLAKARFRVGRDFQELGRLAEAVGPYRAALADYQKLVADFPIAPGYRSDLAGSQVNFGNLLSDQQKPAEALPWFDQALALLEPLHQAEPRDATTGTILRNAHTGRALALDALGRPAEAAHNWEQALALSPAAGRRHIQMERAASVARAGRAAEAVKQIEPLLAGRAVNAGTLYDGACVFALCAAATKHDTSQAKRYADRALELPRRAVAAGHKDVAHMKKDDDRAAVRDREEFRQLIADLEKKPPPKKGQ